MELFIALIIIAVLILKPKKSKYIPKINPNSLLNPYKSGWMDNDNYTEAAICKRYGIELITGKYSPMDEGCMYKLYGRIVNYTREVDKEDYFSITQVHNITEGYRNAIKRDVTNFKEWSKTGDFMKYLDLDASDYKLPLG